MLEPIVIVGGFLSQTSDYRSWAAKLQAPPYNRKVFIARIDRGQWVATRDDTFRPQIAAIAAIVEQARRETGSERVWLVCHSAGGRVARLWMGDKPYGGSTCGGNKYVSGLICLGSPYTTKEPWAQRSSTFANLNYPGAFYPDIKYVSAIGKAVFGRPNGTVTERLAFQSYKTLDPLNAQKWGDGVITLDSALVPNAENLIIDGIHHVGLLGRPGYSDSRAMSSWAKALISSK